MSLIVITERRNDSCELEESKNGSGYVILLHQEAESQVTDTLRTKCQLNASQMIRNWALWENLGAPAMARLLVCLWLSFAFSWMLLAVIPQSSQTVALKGTYRNRLGASFDMEIIGSLLPLFKETKQSVPLKWEQRGSEKWWLLFAKSCQAVTTAGGSLIYLVSRDINRVKWS